MLLFNFILKISFISIKKCENFQPSILTATQKICQRDEVIAELIAKDGLTLNQLVKSKFLAKAFTKFGWVMPSSATTITKIMRNQAEI